MTQDTWAVGGRVFSSRLILGTGKYKDFKETALALEASGAEVATVAIRRTNIGQEKGESLLDHLSLERLLILPNTAGCYNAPEAIRTLRLARELLGHPFAKLEVLGDEKTLYPHVGETLKAAEVLVKEGFVVMAYTNDDPIAARALEDLGVAAVMPLASLIGSGMGIVNPYHLSIIIGNAKVPVVVDAGVGTASDAAIAMELGSDAVLTNTAVARARDPVLMAQAMKRGVEAGRLAFLAGRMPRQVYAASASSPPRDFLAAPASSSPQK